MQGGRRPGPDHPITIAPAGERVVVKLDDAVLADSRNALILKEASLNPVYYIPRADVAMSELSPSDTSTTAHTRATPAISAREVAPPRMSPGLTRTLSTTC